MEQIEDEDFTEEEDRFIVRCLYKYGYNSWELIKNEIRNCPKFRFNWVFLSKTANDLRRRSDYLIDLFKEQQVKSIQGKSKSKAKPKIKTIKAKSESVSRSRKDISIKEDSEDDLLSDLKSDSLKQEKHVKKVALPRNNTRPARKRKVVSYKEA